MAAYINTNIASLNAQRNLNASQGALQTSLQRLSSGLRINSAKDDAAGLAIADRFSTQIRGLNQAVRNANDGISLAQTAEGALGEMGNNLQRIRELAVQASNASNSASDRLAIDQEVQQRLAEIDRTAAQTSFNGQKILDGSLGSANFQVGANAGETIAVNLGTDTSMRASALGKIASITSGIVGSASGGSLTTGSITLGDFSQTNVTAVNSSLTLTPLSTVFGASSHATSTIDASAFAGFDFSVAGNGGLGFNDATTFAAIGTLDFTGGGVGQFDVQVGALNIGVTLTADYSSDGNYDNLAQDIQDQLNQAAGNGAFTVAINNGTGQMTITNNNGTDAVVVQNADANSGVTNDAGTTGVASTNATFTVGGNTVTLNTNIGSAAALASAIEGQLTGYTVQENSGMLTITRTGSASAADVAIAGTTAGTPGLGDINHAGTAGSSSASASFQIDGVDVTLSGVSGMSSLVSTMQSELDNNSAPGTYTVAAQSDGTVRVTKNGVHGETLAITGADAQAASTGFANGAGTAVTGNAGSTSSAIALQIDGHSISLNGDYSSGTHADLATELQTKLNTAAGSGTYTVSAGSGGSLTIEKTAAGSTAVAITSASSDTSTAGFAPATGTAGSMLGALSLTGNDFTIKVGTSDARSVTGTFNNLDELAAEINKSVAGVYATNNGGALKLTSSFDIELGGASATAGNQLNFGATAATASTGSLSDASVRTVDDALATIQRVDAALGKVSDLRSVFGAVQNRFESVISNLSSTSENLSAARSRIQDADFAAETATLTRAQILQQAGTAMLAQANSLPNGVLALLRG